MNVPLPICEYTVSKSLRRTLANPFIITAASKKHSHRGFTLIELLVVIAITAILAVIAVPSFVGTMNDLRQKSALGLLRNDLNQARGEAIKRNTRVLICARNAAGTDCASTTSWLSGWVVCTEGTTANTCAATTASDPNPLIVRPALDAALTINKTSAVLTEPVRFSANSTASAATLVLGGTWNGAINRTITVAATGNISSQ